MLQQKKTHRMVNNPQISGRYLADYMAASDVKRRSIIAGCKYQPVARVVQHNEAKLHVGRFLRGEISSHIDLLSEAQRLRARLVDESFEQDVVDHNADYIERFAEIAGALKLPEAERLAPGACPSIEIQGVKVTAELAVRFRRATATNDLKLGGAMLRYSKGRELKGDIAEWQAAFIFLYLRSASELHAGEADPKLCFAIDAYSGAVTAAPGNTSTRIKNMEAACAGIAERWENIPPPPNAVF